MLESNGRIHSAVDVLFRTACFVRHLKEAVNTVCCNFLLRVSIDKTFLQLPLIGPDNTDSFSNYDVKYNSTVTYFSTEVDLNFGPGNGATDFNIALSLDLPFFVCDLSLAD